MKRIVVLGAGRVGAAMARDLASEFQVEVVDQNQDFLDLLRGEGIPGRRADLSAPEAVQAVVAQADVVVGAVPGFMGFRTMRAVLEAGRDIVDISFYEEDPFGLEDVARNRIALMDCGVAPGCGNMILGHLERELDRVDRWDCLVGGLPVVRTWPFEYKAGFSPIDVLEEYTRPARFVEHGRLVTRPALSDPELVDFPGVGTLESFNTDGLRSLIRTSDAPFRKEKTLRYPGHIEKMRMLREMGLFSKEPVEVKGHPVVPLDLTTRLLFPLWQMGEGEEDFTVMRVIVEGASQGQPRRFVYDLLDRFDAATGTTSMARTTGYTCTAAVRAVAQGRFNRRGISPPEFLGREGCWPFIRGELAQRGVLFTEAASG
ncbi:MAG: saccharopine dehydrogenase NADP-binding domain-containing protein [Acidobacteria bacterium]|nr:saccharopine dehydrogenase NADP-binding domain-containing protein [Acidobacteriota bacterium]